MYDNPLRDWTRVSTLVVNGVTEQKYKTEVAAGLVQGKQFLSNELVRDPIPSNDAIRTAHALVFDRIYPFAGAFRHGEQHPAIGEKDDIVHFQPAYVSRIEPELKRLGDYAREVLKEDPPQHTKAEVIALYHAQFERIHPFLDGNGRVGRLILEAQITHVLGQTPEPILDRESYIEGLWQAHTTGNLSQLTYVTTGIPLERDQALTSYQRELWPITLTKATQTGHPLTIQCPDIDTALDVDAAIVSFKLEQHIEKQGTSANVPLLLDESARPLRLDLDEETLAQNRRLEQKKSGLAHEQ